MEVYVRNSKFKNSPIKYNKFNNNKIVLHGLKFHSEKEAAFYLQLCDRKKRGEIKNFILQPRIELQPKFVNNQGKKIREISYYGDFLIINNDDSEELIDTKGYITPEFKLKKKMLEYRHPNIKLTLI